MEKISFNGFKSNAIIKEIEAIEAMEAKRPKKLKKIILLGEPREFEEGKTAFIKRFSKDHSYELTPSVSNRYNPSFTIDVYSLPVSNRILKIWDYRINKSPEFFEEANGAILVLGKWFSSLSHDCQTKYLTSVFKDIEEKYHWIPVLILQNFPGDILHEDINYMCMIRKVNCLTDSREELLAILDDMCF